MTEAVLLNVVGISLELDQGVIRLSLSRSLSVGWGESQEDVIVTWRDFEKWDEHFKTVHTGLWAALRSLLDCADVLEVTFPAAQPHVVLLRIAPSHLDLMLSHGQQVLRGISWVASHLRRMTQLPAKPDLEDQYDALIADDTPDALKLTKHGNFVVNAALYDAQTAMNILMRA